MTIPTDWRVRISIDHGTASDIATYALYGVDGKGRIFPLPEPKPILRRSYEHKLVCSCGFVLPTASRYDLLRVRPCPECGGTSRRLLRATRSRLLNWLRYRVALLRWRLRQ